MSSKLLDLLKNVGADDSAPTFGEPNPEEVLQFKTSPLASIMLHTYLGSTLDNLDYEQVFENDGEYLGYNSAILKDNLCDQPEFYDTCNRANEIVDYFSNLMAFKRIKGTELSKFEESLIEFINLSKSNQAKIGHIPLACKLPLFYESQQHFISTTKDMTSFDTDDESISLKTKLTPLQVFWKHTKIENKKYMFLHFKTEQNYLVEYRVDKSSMFDALFKSKQFKNISLDSKLIGRSLTHPITNFTYIIADDIAIYG